MRGKNGEDDDIIARVYSTRLRCLHCRGTMKWVFGVGARMCGGG